MNSSFVFTHRVNFPNLTFTEVDFSACCKSFSDSFASIISQHIVGALYDWTGERPVDDVWHIQQINIRYDENCWDIVIEVLAAAGSFLRGVGQTLEALNERQRMTEDKMRHVAIDAAEEGIAEVSTKYLTTRPQHEMTHSQDMGDFKTYANENEARAALTKPEDIQQVPSPNRYIELHVLIPDDAKSSFTIAVHTNKDEDE